MGTNVYHQASQDLFGPEPSPARWRVPKGAGPKEVFELSEDLDVYLDDGLALAGRQAFRLAAKKIGGAVPGIAFRRPHGRL